MNDKKICFVSIVKDKSKYDECVEYIKNIIVPDGYSIDINYISDSQSVPNSYNLVIKSNDAKYKVYVKEDILICNQNFIIDILNIFKDQSIGIIGIHANKNKEDLQLEEELIMDVEYIYEDLIVTQYDILWDEDLAIINNSIIINHINEFTNSGYRVVIAKQEEPWYLYNSKYCLNNEDDDSVIYSEKQPTQEDYCVLDILKKDQPERIISELNTHIGAFTYGDPNILNYLSDSKVIIGKFCSIAQNVIIFIGGEHRADWITTYPFNVFLQDFTYVKGNPTTKGDVIIGNDVWIGYGATIMSGVTIGDGAVIGTNSLVTKDVEPYSIVGGNPARRIRYRFSENQIERLLDIKWWDWPYEKIIRYMPILLSNDIDKIINID
ncbi:hypothetical protein CHL78_017100 [Romboutsia weinsteinii]|uniref:Streptomycin biosynthesis protein StrF domain-containing protein n=1 Tax=Romboutsia weinsteinii TaxID=2020949 RepID=A0A371IYU2_9FIRM|nr:glycosyltransferase [Romboutsia weinsteinii]RDY25647.1 hypothetical protein CHL78_017100 [Romboutsia weinsteinii]